MKEAFPPHGEKPGHTQVHPAFGGGVGSVVGDGVVVGGGVAAGVDGGVVTGVGVGAGAGAITRATVEPRGSTVPAGGVLLSTVPAGAG